MFSQNDEEQFIVQHFAGRSGRALDVGAHGAKLSNTMRLFELGWSGVCVEPSPICCGELLKLHKDNAKIEIMNVAIGEKCELIEFHDSLGDALSTSSPANLQKWKASAEFRKIYVHTITPLALLERFGFGFDFLSLDVEGLSTEMMLLFPIADMPQLSLVCVEHDSQQQRIIDYTTPHGFKVIAENAENLILAR